MSIYKVIQHSDRVAFSDMLTMFFEDGWRVVPGTITVAAMRAEDLHFAVIEHESGVPRCEQHLRRIAAIVKNKKRTELTAADLKSIKELSDI